MLENIDIIDNANSIKEIRDGLQTIILDTIINIIVLQ